MTDSYIYAIVALLPITALMLVSQSNPYNALILRGILGAIAALIYAILGAADVALTEALMGTLLSISLYAIAVRSSMVVRVGILNGETTVDAPTMDQLCAKHYSIERFIPRSS
jgi:putative multicomponent Na+:H+ antiporter subunit B